MKTVDDEFDIGHVCLAGVPVVGEIGSAFGTLGEGVSELRSKISSLKFPDCLVETAYLLALAADRSKYVDVR